MRQALRSELHRAGDLAGAEATGTNVHVLGSAVDNSLDPLDIRLPSAVGTAVRVGHLNAERNALIAKLAFSHDRTSSLEKLTKKHRLIY